MSRRSGRVAAIRMSQTVDRTRTQHRTGRAWTVRVLVLLLILLIGAHHALLLSPAPHEHGLSESALADTDEGTGGPCDGLCSLCSESQCPVMLTTVPHVTAPPIAAILILSIGVLLISMRRIRGRLPWLWPPNRRRLLLQVFQI